MGTISEITNEDCMVMMARYPDKYFDLAVVDPPYGENDAINLISFSNNHKAKRGNYKEFNNIKPSSEYFKELIRVSVNQIVWGGNYFSLSGGVIVWMKNGTAFGEGEIAICSTHKSVRFFKYIWNGMIQQNMTNKEVRIHPTQKPIALYSWLLTHYASPGDKILDTHMGGQSSRIAAYKLGFNYWGAELDPDYYKAGCERFEKAINEPMMAQVLPPTQLKLFNYDNKNISKPHKKR